jgi:hypothetical protein
MAYTRVQHHGLIHVIDLLNDYFKARLLSFIFELDVASLNFSFSTCSTDKDRWSRYSGGNAWEFTEVYWCCSTRYCKLTKHLSLESRIAALAWSCKLWNLSDYVQVLFNDTIFHNIHYGRLSSTEEEVTFVVLYLGLPFHFTNFLC